MHFVKYLTILANISKADFLQKGFKGILVIWFLLCILPGDCLLLGCGGGDDFHCHEKESTLVSQHCDNASVPQDDQHCPNCCVLCAHNVILDVLQNSSFPRIHSSRRFKTFSFKRPMNIFQTVIYHPPRLTT